MRRLRAAPCEQERLDSAQRKRKVRLYFITQVLCLFPGNCSWALPVTRSKEEHLCEIMEAKRWNVFEERGVDCWEAREASGFHSREVFDVLPGIVVEEHHEKALGVFLFLLFLKLKYS